jgi:hypothetical protein
MNDKRPISVLELDGFNRGKHYMRVDTRYREDPNYILYPLTGDQFSVNFTVL